MAADCLGGTCLSILTVASPPAREQGKEASWDMKQVVESVLAE